MKFLRECEPAWCPGCGNFPIRNYLAEALEELDLGKENILMCTGIGQAAKMPHYLELNFFNGLHGRSLPVAFAAKVVNPDLTVIAESGDGDMYGEGGNHLFAGIRRNVDITVLVHDNQIYGLTKGQGSPTTAQGQVTTSQVWGVTNEPLNPVAFAISMDTSFVGRTWSGDKEHFKKVVKAAINHKGFSMVDIMHPCVSFNRVNNFSWYKSHLYDVNEKYPDYNPKNRVKAFEISIDTEEKFPMGIIYINNKKTYHQIHPVLKDGRVIVKNRAKVDVTDEFEKYK
jgi:2-oxoglutarate ferredoxin oxidoreductase subunit beta